MKLIPCILISTIIFMNGTAYANGVSMAGLKISINKIEQPGVIDLAINNSADAPIKIWKESNGWGAARWRIFVMRRGQLEVFFQNPNQLFTKNTPTFNEIAAAAHYQQRLDLNGGDWCTKQYCAPFSEKGIGGRQIQFEPGDMIIVVYDVPRTEEAVQSNIWYGVLAAQVQFK